jgi:hypothetical protein
MSQLAASKVRAVDKSYLILLGSAALALTAYYFTPELRGDPPRPHSRQLLMLCFLGIAARHWCAQAEHRLVLLSLSLIGLGLWAGWDCVGIFAFAAAVIALSRSRLPVALRVAGVCILWCAAIVPKFFLERARVMEHLPLYVYWTGIPFSALYLVVERARGVLKDATWKDDALYLLALPRFVSPFIQAIPASTFLRSQAPSPASDPKLALRGAGLLCYGVVLWVVMAKVPYIPPAPPGVPAHLAPEMRGFHNIVFVYAVNASAIFCAVGLFRLMGFDLPSGFRWPLLSQSFADFYRRFNHYVYETVKSLFMFPLIGRLRTFLPPVLAALTAAYLSIFAGSYCFSVLLVPLALDPSPQNVLRNAFQPKQLLLFFVMWSLIILPQFLPQLLARRSVSAAPTRAGRALRHLLFLSTLAALGWAANVLRVHLL